MVLSVHDSTRMFDDSPQKSGKIIELAKQNVKGGFPCFEKNLPIQTSDRKKHTLKFQGLGTSHLIHNMKWDTKVESGESMDESNREAYLKNLLLHIYADLFDKDLYPQNLKWAYPSAMSYGLVQRYNAIWKSLERVNPLNPEKYPISISKAKSGPVMRKDDPFKDFTSSEGDVLVNLKNQHLLKTILLKPQIFQNLRTLKKKKFQTLNLQHQVVLTSMILRSNFLLLKQTLVMIKH